MEIYKKVEYIHKDKAQKIYKDIAEKQFIMAFFRNALRLKKSDKLQRNRSRKEEEWKNKDQVERCCAISETQTVCCSPVI
jgi:hypothetical protein